MADETRVSQVVVQPAITPGTVDARASQLVVQAAVTPGTVNARASQVVVQFAILLSDAVPGGGGGGERAWGYILGG